MEIGRARRAPPRAPLVISKGAPRRGEDGMAIDPVNDAASTPRATGAQSPGHGKQIGILLAIMVVGAVLYEAFFHQRGYVDDKPPLDISYQDFLAKKHAQVNPEEKEKFAAAFLGRRVTWDCVVLKAEPHSIRVSLSGGQEPVNDRANFYFPDGVPDPKPAEQQTIKLSGMIESVEPPGPILLTLSRIVNDEDDEPATVPQGAE
jgi:hypothetical protein